MSHSYKLGKAEYQKQYRKTKKYKLWWRKYWKKYYAKNRDRIIKQVKESSHKYALARMKYRERWLRTKAGREYCRAYYHKYRTVFGAECSARAMGYRSKVLRQYPALFVAKVAHLQFLQTLRRHHDSSTQGRQRLERSERAGRRRHVERVAQASRNKGSDERIRQTDYARQGADRVPRRTQRETQYRLAEVKRTMNLGS